MTDTPRDTPPASPQVWHGRPYVPPAPPPAPPAPEELPPA